MYKQISSLQNPLVKQILLLKDKSRERKKTGLFVIEGERELLMAVKAEYDINTILFNPDFFPQEKLEDIDYDKIEIIQVSKEVYQKLAYRETTEGVLAIVKAKDHSLSTLNITNKNPLILVMEAPEKPGNIGALLRTADAANLDAVIIANPKTDLYNPNIIRSSVGCVFTNHIATGNSTEIISFLKANNIQINCAALTASVNYHTVNFNVPTAIIVGTEDEGLSHKWLHSSSQNIIIPMQGEIDSLNVSVSAAIIIFEAKRQRNFL